MELIKILFYLIGTFFGVENSRIAAEKVIVTIHPKERMVEIQQENLFSIIQTPDDSIKLAEEWQLINNTAERTWAEEIAHATDMSITYTTGAVDDPDQKILNLVVSFKYKDEDLLKSFSIESNEEVFSLINIESWHIKTEDGELNGNYWNFGKDKPFTFTVEAFTDMPEQYKALQVSMFEMYK